MSPYRDKRSYKLFRYTLCGRRCKRGRETGWKIRDKYSAAIVSNLGDPAGWPGGVTIGKTFTGVLRGP